MTTKSFFVVLLLLSLLAPNVLGAAIGVNKAVINFEDILSGGYAQDSLIISTDVDRDVGIETSVSGDIKDWISFEPKELIVQGKKPGALTVIMQPPADIPEGIYTGDMILMTSPLFNIRSGLIGSAVRTSFKIKITVEVTNDEIVSCSAGGFNIKNSEINFPLEFSARIQNTGNIRIRPDFNIDIWNFDQSELLLSRSFSYGFDILPTITQSVTRELSNVNLDTGQYWAEISSPLCRGQALTTFDVLEKGEIVDKGELLSVSNDLWMKVGDIVPIKAVFKNTGTRVESIKLKGTVKLAGQIIKVIDGDPIDVDPGETVGLETFFNPKMEGQYIINVRVLYNNKLTHWKGSVLNALSSEEFNTKIKELQKKYWSELGIIAIVIIILILLIMIRKKKAKSKRKHHKF